MIITFKYLNLCLNLLFILDHLAFFLCVTDAYQSKLQLFTFKPGHYDKKYAIFSEKKRKEMLAKTREMFTFGYDNYMKYAFPKDELNPILCTGRGPDTDNP